MPIDLTSLAKEALGGGLMDQLAGALDESPEVTRNAVDAGIPAVLGGLLSKMQNSGGVDDIMGALDENDGGLLSNLAGSLFGGGQSGILAKGASLVAMIYGARQGGVLGSLASMVGMRNTSGATKLLGMLAPVVMGFIRKQRAADNLDASGVQSLLTDQKQFIADKLPDEMRTSLGIADMFDAPAAAPRVAAVPQPEPVKSGSSIFPWLLAAGAAVLAFLFWPSSDESAPAERVGEERVVEETVIEETTAPVQEVRIPDAEAETITNAVPAVIEGGFGDLQSIAGGLTDRLTGLTDKFSSVTDLGSAQALASELGDTNSYLDSLDLDSMPDTARSSLSAMVGPTVDKLEGATDTLYKIPGVQNVVEPMLNPLMDRLRGL